MKRFVALLLLGTWLGLSSPAFSAEMPVLVLNNTNEPPYTTPDGNGFLDLVVREAFRRAGVQLRLVRLPAERALINVDAGLEDGDLTRIVGLEQNYPNLVRVPEKLIDWEFAAFSQNSALPARWNVLRAVPVGHIRGWKIYEKQLEGAPHVISSDDAAQMFRLLQLGRIDAALYERWMGMSLVRRQAIQNVHLLDPNLARREMYIYLNKRHAALVPRIAEALRAIKAEGLYDRLYKEKVTSAMAAAAK